MTYFICPAHTYIPSSLLDISTWKTTARFMILPTQILFSLNIPFLNVRYYHPLIFLSQKPKSYPLLSSRTICNLLPSPCQFYHSHPSSFIHFLHCYCPSPNYPHKLLCFLLHLSSYLSSLLSNPFSSTAAIFLKYKSNNITLPETLLHLSAALRIKLINRVRLLCRVSPPWTFPVTCHDPVFSAPSIFIFFCGIKICQSSHAWGHSLILFLLTLYVFTYQLYYQFVRKSFSDLLDAVKKKRKEKIPLLYESTVPSNSPLFIHTIYSCNSTGIWVII